MKDPKRALFFSLLVPGLGQLYLGERTKGWTFVCMDAGVAASLIFSHTWVAWLLGGGIYLAIMIPAASDAFQAAQGQPRTFKSSNIVYVIVMLLMIGPFAFPLLWQSSEFSKRAKILWTLAVILIALLAIAALVLSASFLEQLVKDAGTV